MKNVNENFAENNPFYYYYLTYIIPAVAGAIALNSDIKLVEMPFATPRFELSCNAKKEMCYESY